MSTKIRQGEWLQKGRAMSPREIDHHLIDANLSIAEIRRRLQKQFNLSVSRNYVSQILHGDRTGYKLRPFIAKIAGLKLKDIPLPPKKSDPKRTPLDRSNKGEFFFGKGFGQ